jgi:hypothetical protein
VLMNWPDIPQLWANLSLYEDRWKFTYPGLEIVREVLRMGEWLEAHPRRRWPRNFKRFMTGWLARSQAHLEAVSLREQIQRAQQRTDSNVGKFRQRSEANK